MTNKSTKRTLLTSVLSLFLCFTMLVGTTFAWFTDSATSGSNVITAGSLDLEVEYTLDGATWNDLKDADDIFQKGLWEPGHTEMVALKITNAGDLALKYVANLDILSETVGKTADGNDIVLSEILTVSTLALGADQANKVVAAFASENGVSYDNTDTLKNSVALRGDTEMLSGDVHYLIVKVDMADTVGNEANSDGVNVPSIDFDIAVLATQLSYENDSFGTDYDADATYMNKNADGEWEIGSVGQLLYFAQIVNSGASFYEGETVVLTSDIDLKGINWAPIGSMTADHGFMGNFDGQGHTIKNLTIVNPAVDEDGYAYAGFFGLTEGTDKDNQNFVKNLVIENVTISTEGNIVAAAIAYAYYTTVEDITVCGDIAIEGGDYTAGALAYTRRCVDAKNITVSGNDGSYITGGMTVGGVISDIQMNGGLTANYANFAASNLTITGEKSVGGISGIICNQTLNGATVTDVTLVCNDPCTGIVAGATSGNYSLNDATYTNVTGATELVGAPWGT